MENKLENIKTVWILCREIVTVSVISLHRYFDEETFEHVSAEAKDFISNLLIKERGWGTAYI